MSEVCYPIHTIQTDNGNVFKKTFIKLLKILKEQNMCGASQEALKHRQADNLGNLNQINNFYEAKIMICWFIRLYNRHIDFINQRSFKYNFQLKKKRWWYTHKTARKTYRIIINANPNMFTYLKCGSPRASPWLHWLPSAYGGVTSLNARKLIHARLKPGCSAATRPYRNKPLNSRRAYNTFCAILLMKK